MSRSSGVQEHFMLSWKMGFCLDGLCECVFSLLTCEDEGLKYWRWRKLLTLRS